MHPDSIDTFSEISESDWFDDAEILLIGFLCEKLSNKNYTFHGEEAESNARKLHKAAFDAHISFLNFQNFGFEKNQINKEYIIYANELRNFLVSIEKSEDLIYIDSIKRDFWSVGGFISVLSLQDMHKISDFYKKINSSVIFSRNESALIHLLVYE